MKMTVLAEAFKKAEEKKKNDGNGPLPDLDQIKVQELTPDEIAEREKKVQERKQWAEGAAQKLSEIQEKIAQLKRLELHGVLTPEDKGEIAHLEELKSKLLNAGDKELQKHVKFAEFLEEIRNAIPHKELTKAFLNQVVAEGRYRLATEEETNQIRHDKKWPQGTIFFGGKVYLPAFSEEEKSAGQRALEAELTRYLREMRKSEMKKEKAETDQIKESANRGLPLLKQEEKGKYALMFSVRTDENGRKWKPGAGLIEVKEHKISEDKVITVVEVIKGTGSLEWLNKHKDEWIPYSWYKHEIPETAPDPEFAEKFIKTIRAALAAYYSTH